MAIKKVIGPVLAIAFLAGCNTVPDEAKSELLSEKTDRLAARDLAPGECALFVWTADSAKRFILFSKAADPTAVWWTKDGDMILNRISSTGFSTYGEPPVQTFSMSDGGTLKLTLAEAEDITGGTRYKSGAITLSDPQGWEKFMPVIGLAGCQTP